MSDLENFVLSYEDFFMKNSLLNYSCACHLTSYKLIKPTYKCAWNIYTDNLSGKPDELLVVTLWWTVILSKWE